MPCTFLVPPRKKQATEHSSNELLQRIERLEAAFEASRAIRATDVVSIDGLRPGYTTALHHPAVDKTRRYGGNEEALGDVARHELEESMSAAPNDGPAFRIASVQEIIDCARYHHATDQSAMAPRSHVMRVPTYKVAMALYKSYEFILDAMCRILHVPTLRALIESFYVHVAQFQAIPIGEAALVLSVLAVSAFFTPQLGESAATSADTPAALSKVLAAYTLRVLDHSRRTTSGSLEDIQAYTLMSYIDFHHHGYSPKSRLHIGVAMLLSRDLGLHRTDADPDVLDSTLTPRARLDKELRRRAFWYLASAEW